MLYNAEGIRPEDVHQEHKGVYNRAVQYIFGTSTPTLKVQLVQINCRFFISFYFLPRLKSHVEAILTSSHHATLHLATQQR